MKGDNVLINHMKQIINVDENWNIGQVQPRVTQRRNNKEPQPQYHFPLTASPI